MRMKETVVARSARLMVSGGVALGVGLVSMGVRAEDAAPAPAAAEPSVQRVEITGSSIKRIAKEGALPVQTYTAADIQKTGATSVTDLLQKLPAVQGFVPAASTINGAGGQDGGGGGATTAALHAMASKYTLVLLDGQRIAPLQLGANQGGGYGADIGTIPMDAIERVEVLTDGASSLYGSDAIAGVVNFITRKNTTGGDVFFKYDRPQHPGGRSWSAGFSKGIGDLNADNYNLLFSYSHDSQDPVQASQRSASRNGSVFHFSANGQNYTWVGRSTLTTPGNLTFTTTPAGGGAKATYSFNPYYVANGSCGNNPYQQVRTTAAGVSTCQFNTAALSEDEPQTKRDSALAKATFNLNPDTRLWLEGLLTRASVTNEFAPAAASLTVSATGTNFPSLYAKYVTPYVTAHNLAAPATVTLGYRSNLLGERSDDYVATTSQLAAGIDGQWKDWTYDATLSMSHVNDQDRLAGGYGDLDLLKAQVAAGLFDPVMNTGGGSLASTLLTGMTVSTTLSDVNSAKLGLQHDTFELPGGTSILSMGVDATYARYRINPSTLERDNSGYATQSGSTDIAVGSQAAQVPFDASRSNFGVYGEWLLPLAKSLEVTLSDRFNKYAKVHSRDRFSTTVDPVTKLIDQLPDGSVGNSFTADTYKASFRFTPVDTVLLRGAFGTGFKAPDLGDIASPVAFSAPTSASYVCPFPGTSGCLSSGTQTAQYSVLKGGNSLSGSAGLKPERSQQWTLGFRVDPIKGFSAGADLWAVQIKNQVLPTGVTEQKAFANPQQYASLFIDPYSTPTGATGIGLLEITTNGGVAHYRGVDWDISYQTKTPIGDWSTTWTGTQMLKQDYTLQPGGTVNSDLGKFGADLGVVFRTQMRLLTSLQTGAFSNSLTMNWKSGYHDQAQTTTVYLASDTAYLTPVPFGGLHVHSFATFDAQSKYQATKALSVTFGIKNLFDRAPPLSLQTSGGGNYSGYDGRYYDILGRTYYMGGNYKF